MLEGDAGTAEQEKPAPGTTPFGRCALARKIAEGGMAEVHLAHQRGPADFEKTVLVKRIRQHLTTNERFVEMFLREARIAARLNHPNVVQIHELGEVDGELFIAMALTDALPLHRAAHVGPPPCAQMWALAMATAPSGPSRCSRSRVGPWVGAPRAGTSSARCSASRQASPTHARLSVRMWRCTDRAAVPRRGRGA